MAQLEGEICCNVIKWCSLVESLTTAQRQALKKANLECTLLIPPIMMRTYLLRYMVEMYDRDKKRFIIQENTGEIQVSGEDVECIFGFIDYGTSIMELVLEEGEYASTHIPERFVSPKTGNLVIDDLIFEIKNSADAGDDFLRRIVLVLIGTILAPHTKKIVARQYYAIVEHVDRIPFMNWNAFTREILHGELRRVTSGPYVTHWPGGNLILLQYLYWEKVHPVIDGAIHPAHSLRPLVRNWTERRAMERDTHDYRNGHGVGIVEDCITEDYRLKQLNNTPDIQSKRKDRNDKGGTSSKKAANPMPSADMNLFMETLLKKVVDHINTNVIGHFDKKFDRMSDQCAQKVLKALNHKGVVYKPVKGTIFDNGQDPVEDIVSTNSCQIEPGKEFMECDDSSDDGVSCLGEPYYEDPLQEDIYVTPVKVKVMEGSDMGKTPENPIPIRDNIIATPESSLDVPPLAVFMGKMKKVQGGEEGAADSEFDSLATMCRKTIESDKNKHVVGKRMRKIPSKLQGFPFVVDKALPRKSSASKRVLFQIDDLDERQIAAAVTYVTVCSKLEKYCKECVYSDAEGFKVAAERLSVILDRDEWLSSDVMEAYLQDLSLRVGSDRHICKVYRSKFLLDVAKTAREVQESPNNNDTNLERSGAVSRAMDEYFVRDKAYFAVNIKNSHWVTVVLHVLKQQFQLLDSLASYSLTNAVVNKLRAEIAKDIEIANRTMAVKYPDVSKWPIVKIDMPQQGDGSSCGLFVLHAIEHWDGDEFTTELSQKYVDDSRDRTVARIVLAKTNNLNKVKERVMEIAEVSNV